MAAATEARAPTTGPASRRGRYLFALACMARAGRRRATSADLAGPAGLNSSQVRRDLGALHLDGRRGVGYGVGHLLKAMRPREDVRFALFGDADGRATHLDGQLLAAAGVDLARSPIPPVCDVAVLDYRDPVHAQHVLDALVLRREVTAVVVLGDYLLRCPGSPVRLFHASPILAIAEAAATVR